MTRDEIMALSGRELDAAVAEHVMGYRRRIVPKDVDGKHGGTEVLVPASVYHDSFCYPPKGPIPFTFFVPHYSTDIASAWQAVEHMLRQGWHLNLQSLTSDGTTWSAMFERPGVYEIYRGPSPEAICKAALLAHFTDVRAGKNGGGAE